MTSCGVNTTKCFKYVWPFSNVMHGRVNYTYAETHLGPCQKSIMVDAFSHCLLWVKHPGILVFCNPYFSVGKKRVIENLCCGICCAMLFTQKSSTMTIGKGTIQASVKWSTETEKFESGVWHGRQILFSTLSRFLCGNSMPLQ